MPELDGIEFIEQAKAKFPDVRIIAISAGGMGMKGDEMLDIASGMGAEKIVTKPFSNEDISTAVTAMLQ
jgi:CheY-like chemotaxis protein